MITESGHSPSYSGLCHFLYYWLGSIVWNKGKNVLTVTTFLEAMENIYSAFEQFGVPNNCELFYKDNSEINKEIFKHRRTVFDFSFDYKNIKQKLESHNNSCDEQYYQHLKSAFDAFQAVSADCHRKIDLYCMEFKNTFETKNNNSNNNQNPLTLTEGEKTQSSGETTIYKNVSLNLNFAPPKTNTAMIATISSIFSITALGFAASLLYKVIIIITII
ncbi:Variable surface protein Vir7-like protein [Plasmodium coatneyi]|uniref:Variable surface protein Vir7-like protein n=1 Tax=Plasmodium coatneyi TaxID=208452 RepID=A0A1B1E130_9APIC|nr:Variable surface protein Vir7-like protein [Plasmodium coatneyi]ANQ08743.1 Variable surface protein Vir7-like protein [Plasmodium coatneyi]